jgi:dUTP pyrophosphatase
MEHLLKVYLAHKNAKLPDKANETDACWDLYANKDTRIPSAGSCEWVSTGIKLRLPKGYFARVYGRSGFSRDNKIMIGAGVIDEGYTGELKVLVFNFSAYPLTIVAGTKFAQFSLHKRCYIDLEQVKTEEELGTTERGEKGFGSSD